MKSIEGEQSQLDKTLDQLEEQVLLIRIYMRGGCGGATATSNRTSVFPFIGAL